MCFLDIEFPCHMYIECIKSTISMVIASMPSPQRNQHENQFPPHVMQFTAIYSIASTKGCARMHCTDSIHVQNALNVLSKYYISVVKSLKNCYQCFISLVTLC